MKFHFPFDYKKATQALNYFAEKSGGKIDKLLALKLIFLTDRFHLRKYSRPVTGDQYIAMKLGPVPSSVKDIADFTDYAEAEWLDYAKDVIENKTGRLIESLSPVDQDEFSESDEEALKFAWDNFGMSKPLELAEDITHEYPEWKKHEKEILEDKQPRMPMDYEDFFDEPEKDGINPCFFLTDEEKKIRKDSIQEKERIEALL